MGIRRFKHGEKPRDTGDGVKVQGVRESEALRFNVTPPPESSLVSVQWKADDVNIPGATAAQSPLIDDSYRGKAISVQYTVQMAKLIYRVPAPNRLPVFAAALDFGNVTVDTGLLLDNSNLLVGVTDADNDTLTVTQLEVLSGSASIAGSAPSWTLTPTALGPITFRITISDGKGTVTRTASLVGASLSYAALSMPANFSWFPYNVYANNTTDYHPDMFRPTGKTYYIAPNGLDTNSGLTPGAPMKTVAAAANKADCVIVMAAPGDYENGYWGDVSFQTNFRGLICDGPGRARFHAGPLNVGSNFVPDATNPGAYKWAASGNVRDCRDEAWPTIWGHAGWMTKQTSAANVAATPNSFYSDGTSLWVRLRNDRVPDNRLRVFKTQRNYIGKSTFDLYWKGLDFIGGNVLPHPSGSNIRNHLYQCDFAYGNGIDDGLLLTNGANPGFITYCTEVKAYGARLDCFSLQGSAKGVYVNCEGYDAPIAGSNNANTMHGSASAILIGGNYHDVSGDVVISVSTGAVFCLGVISRDCPGTSASDFSSTAGPMWLVNCTNRNSISDYTAEGNGAKNVQNNDFTLGSINAALTPVTVYSGPGIIPTVPVAPVIDSALVLDSVTMGESVVLTGEDLMVGTTGGEFVIEVTATNATVVGDGFGPWTVTPTAVGTVTVTYTVSNRYGKFISRSATMSAVAPVLPFIKFDGSTASRAIIPAWAATGDFDLTFHTTLETTAVDRQLFANPGPFEPGAVRIYYDVPDGWELLIGINGSNSLHRFIFGGQGVVGETPAEVSFRRRGDSISLYINGSLVNTVTIAGTGSLRMNFNGALGGVSGGTTNYKGSIGFIKYDDLVEAERSFKYTATSDGKFAQVGDRYITRPFTLEGTVLIGMDSLTAGVANLRSWPHYLIARATQDGRTGGRFLCADTIGRENQNIFTTNAGLGTGIVMVDTVAAGNASRDWSPHARGIATVPGSLVGTEYFQITSYTTYYHARVYYLAGPAQGSFRIQQPGAGLTVNCYAATLGLAYVDVDVPGGFTALRFDQFTGNVAVYGAMCRTAQYGTPGAFQVANFARASQKITGFDDSKWSEWCDALQVNRVIFNGGMNDKSDPYATVLSALDALTAIFVSKVGADNVLLLRPNADGGTTASTGSGGINAMTGLWETVAVKYRCRYLSTVAAVGDYSVYSANSWLLDSTHPNEAGSGSLADVIYSGDLLSAAGGKTLSTTVVSVTGPARA